MTRRPVPARKPKRRAAPTRDAKAALRAATKRLRKIARDEARRHFTKEDDHE
jgi:hypothetical protein